MQAIIFLDLLAIVPNQDVVQWRLKYTSRRDRFTEKLKGLRKYLRG
ncbi:hypothetical protein [Orientia tsutsugamushi]|nr:hypothetical protein [Orientia tsutsugamushi]